MAEEEKTRDEPRLFEDQINRFIFLEEDRKRAMGILAPTSKEDMDALRLIITNLRGRVPERTKTFKALIAIEDALADMRGEEFDWNNVHLIEWNLEAAMSKDERRAKAIESIGTANPKPPQTKSIMDRMFGRKK
jgi:hypothetical protein